MLSSIDAVNDVFVLSVAERLLLLQVLPKEGTLLTLRLVRKFREELSFSAEEHATVKFKVEGDLVKWEGSCVKEVLIVAPVMELISSALEALDKSGKLTLETAALYERLCPEKVVA